MSTNRVIVNPDYCKLWLCEICVGICPVDNLIVKGSRITDLGSCTACMLCERYCPDLAIKIEKGNGEEAPTRK